MCVTWQALISALVARVTRDDYRLTRSDVEGLLAAGVPRDELTRAFSGDGAAMEHARRIVSEIGH